MPHSRPLLQPTVHDVIAIDGTVMDAPSDVRRRAVEDEDGTTSYDYTSNGSRNGTPRWHDEVGDFTDEGKTAGAEKGLYNVVATTKGSDTYTRTVLALDIGNIGEGEAPIAMRVLRELYGKIGNTFPVLAVDGVIEPGMYQDLLAEFAVYTVNALPAKSGKRPAVIITPDGPRVPLGRTQRLTGYRKGQAKTTYSRPLPSVNHEHHGYVHQHHLAADDGAVYELNRPTVAGGDVYKLHPKTPLTPTDAAWHRDHNGGYYLSLTVTGSCPHGGQFSATYQLRKTKLNKKGHLPATSLMATLRVIPEAFIEAYGPLNGKRNQIESFFSWLDRCFYNHDRHASWGRERQIFDLILAALAHNSITWAHLAYRHPTSAQALRAQLLSLPLTTSQAPRKPVVGLAAERMTAVDGMESEAIQPLACPAA